MDIPNLVTDFNGLVWLLWRTENITMLTWWEGCQSHFFILLIHSFLASKASQEFTCKNHSLFFTSLQHFEELPVILYHTSADYMVTTSMLNMNKDTYMLDLLRNTRTFFKWHHTLQHTKNSSCDSRQCSHLLIQVLISWGFTNFSSCTVATIHFCNEPCLQTALKTVTSHLTNIPLTVQQTSASKTENTAFVGWRGGGIIFTVQITTINSIL